jgi:hypothetical protein
MRIQFVRIQIRIHSDMEFFEIRIRLWMRHSYKLCNLFYYCRIFYTIKLSLRKCVLLMSKKSVDRKMNIKIFLKFKFFKMNIFKIKSKCEPDPDQKTHFIADPGSAILPVSLHRYGT